MKLLQYIQDLCFLSTNECDGLNYDIKSLRILQYVFQYLLVAENTSCKFQELYYR